MTDLTLYAAIMIGTYVLCLIGLGVWSLRKEDHNGFVIGNRNIGLFSTTCSMLAGQFNGGGVFLYFTMGALFGFGWLYGSFGFLAGYLLMVFLAKTVRQDSQDHGDVTIHDFINRYIGVKTKKFSIFMVVGKALLFGTAQLLIAGKVVAAVLGLESEIGIAITAIIIAVYMLLGGYLTVIRTDILQWGFLFAVVILGAFFYPLPEANVVLSDIIAVPRLNATGFFLFTLILILSNADAWQRIMSARSVAVAQKSLVYSGILFVIFSLGLLSIFINWFPNIGEGVNFFSLFETQALPPIVLAVLGVFTLTAVMSTIDTQVYLFTSAIAKNVMKINLETSRIRYVRITRIATIGLLFAMSLAAMFAGSTLQFVLKAFSFAYILAPIILLSLWWKSASAYKDWLCVIALGIGLVVYTYMFATNQFGVFINLSIPTLVTTSVCGFGYILFSLRRR